jgi:hypothetical protein
MSAAANQARQVWFVTCPKTDYCAIHFDLADAEQDEAEMSLALHGKTWKNAGGPIA